ncbi:Hypothetical protein NGAL_HAMBI490_42850 [Neorhizobium galegae bv. officinalis]|nr:Hypothetical protein NGAL_HAMBI490_42850 [Neorhizobium galegae bv. officinalis]
MADISDTKWSELDPSNNSASPDGIQGSYAPNTVAPILRATRGAIKRDYVQSNPIYTSTGTSTAYVLTYAQAPAPITKGKKFVFWAHVTSGTAPTLNVNAQGAKSLLRPDGSALLLGDIQANTVVIAHYDGTAFRVANPDGLDAGQLIAGTVTDDRLPTTQTGKTFTSATTVSGDILSVDHDTSPQIFLRKKTGTINRGQISANIAGSAVTIQTYNAAGVATQKLDIPETGNMQFAGATVWTAGNDGAGSTLDADLLDGYHATALPVSTLQQTALDLKANLASPALTGTPTAPTATAGTNTTQLATTAYVSAAVDAIIGVAAGAIAPFAMVTPPAGWMKCNGAAVSRSTYAALFTAIGTSWGVGNGTTTFNVPDLRGYFLRGLDDGRGVDTGRAFGTAQEDAMQGHRHDMLGSETPTSAGGSGNAAPQYRTGSSATTRDPVTDGVNGTPRTAAETRPKNIALPFFIKF